MQNNTNTNKQNFGHKKKQLYEKQKLKKGETQQLMINKKKVVV